MKSNIFKIFYIVFLVLFIHTMSYSQDSPIKLKVLSSLQMQTEEYKVEDASGYGIGAQMNFSLTRKLNVGLKVHYDHQNLTQDDVLDEWNWEYWEDTYIDFLPGTEPEIVNRTLRYTSTDSIYSAVFEPTQTLKELRIYGGFEFSQPITAKLQAYLGCDAGFSIFFRELKMQEHWTKRFKLDTLTTDRFDYEYEYDLLHFAPSKSGTTFFMSPFIGTKYLLSSSVDLDLGFHYIHYMNRKEIGGLKLSNAAEKWFPLKSKIQISVGITFKY